MDRVKHECTELFLKPTSRCFKGISILTFIFTLCCVMMAAVIGPVIKAHGGTTIDYPILKPGEPTAAEIASRLHIMNQSMIYLSISFTIISLISLGLFFKFVKVEKARMAGAGGFQPVANYSGQPSGLEE